MASDTTNAAVAALRERQRAQLAAVRGCVGAAAGVAAALRRRETALARLNEDVTSALRTEDVALAALSTLVKDDELAALSAGVDVTRVRAACRRAPADEVRAAVAQLGAVRAPGRRRRADVSSPAVAEPADDVEPDAGVFPARVETW